MRLSARGLAGLRAAEVMAMAGGPVTVGHIAARHGLRPATVTKALRALSRAGLVHGHRGAQGGFRLARPAAAITLLQVIEACDRPLVAAPPAVATDPLQRLFAEFDQTARATLAAVSLATLLRGSAQKGRAIARR